MPYVLRDHLPARRWEVLLQNVSDFLRNHHHKVWCLQLTVRDALNSALDEEMVRDDSVFIIGEEVRDDCKLTACHCLCCAMST